MNDLRKAQEALFTWMCIQNTVRYDTIKKYCDYLNIQYDLKIEEHPAWQIFLPIFMAGNVDLCGEGIFKATEPIAVSKKGKYIYTNLFNQPSKNNTVFPFIYTSSEKNLPSFHYARKYELRTLNVLKKFPKVEDIVNDFTPLALNDFSNLTFDNDRCQYGVAKNQETNLSYYFIYPNTRRVVSIPFWRNSPDSINIAFCYGRALDGRGNGIYYNAQKTLNVTRYRFPIMLYRVLILETLLNNYSPEIGKKTYVFRGIDKKIADEVNRILNNSIKYE